MNKKKITESLKDLAAKAQIDKVGFMKAEYNAVRLFCLECELLTFNECERIEYEAKELITN